MNVIKNKKIFLSISGILIIASIFISVFLGLKLGIDFKGGTLWQIKIETRSDIVGNQVSHADRAIIEELKKFFETDLDVKNVLVFPSENSNYLIRSEEITEQDHQSFLVLLKSKFETVEEQKFESIGPAVGGYLKTRALWAIVLVLLGISFYVAYAFRKVSYPVKSWKYGIITLITLFHDVVIPVGLLALLGKISGIELDTNFVVALLVIMGFSVHDTIVVFDRIRENISTYRGNMSFDEIVNKSVNQTFARSINTSLTVALVLLTVYFFGPETIKYFTLIILTGVIVGTYSSIFVASPLLTIWQKLSKVK